LPAQVALQRETFGELSDEVRDYTEIDLPARIDSDMGRKLLEIVDPWNYRERLTLPKLIVLATNDRYWPLDALKLYWNGLTGPKNVLYVPNQGHGVADIDRLIGSLSALHRYSVRGEMLPSIGWTFDSGNDGVIQLTVETDRRPHRVTAWTATSKSRDFRESRWSSRACRKLDATHYQCESRVKPGEHRALYSEVTFAERNEPPFTLSTAVCIKAGAQDKPSC
ncbi:MAG TPA: PhoPQ-activated protein PqaA family protein, partial [Steroidobacteraceae bacterium]